MDYSLLRGFVTVVREGNLTRAVDRLFLTQPALSLQIKKMQHDLGVVMLERTLSTEAEFRAAAARLKAAWVAAGRAHQRFAVPASAPAV